MYARVGRRSELSLGREGEGGQQLRNGNKQQSHMQQHSIFSGFSVLPTLCIENPMATQYTKAMACTAEVKLIPGKDKVAQSNWCVRVCVSERGRLWQVVVSI